MQEANLFLLFTRSLENAGIDYMVTGSVAAMLYGEPRLTHDIDIVIEISKKDVGRFMESFPSESYYCPPEDIIIEEISRSTRGHFNVIHHESGFKADMFSAADDSLHRWGMGNWRRLAVEETKMWVAPVVYVILRKLQYYREGKSDKHLRDIRSMLEISAAEIELSDLEKRVASMGLSEEWEKVRGKSQ